MDSREMAGIMGRKFIQFDERRMVVTFEHYDQDIEMPVAFEVCPTCKGKGVHVNPSIDSHGLTAEDFADDPEFAIDYKRGVYDVSCYGCRGRRVVPVPIRASHRRLIEYHRRAEWQMAAEEAAERRMGA